MPWEYLVSSACPEFWQHNNISTQVLIAKLLTCSVSVIVDFNMALLWNLEYHFSKATEYKLYSANMYGTSLIPWLRFEGMPILTTAPAQHIKLFVHYIHYSCSGCSKS